MTVSALLLDKEVEMSSRIESRYSGKSRCRTARHWLKKLGFCWHKVQEGVYVGGHRSFHTGGGCFYQHLMKFGFSS